ncbi:uncharacterized protein ACA1_214600 [Acanthamoeba castellanii str. Neff]|uniref:F-box domain-containing protein n=1 Tax=Acanthamoeba castellanii (strain ATCC 30010 / Neff) TaxID=1257118 RepID=L8GSF4_ACACF|nr:uncharacterized protein ACA1_214600 [Acanthamoeba castellanii str. Neff]ELR15051.1 hypothetical protein ACA1_214600 [Acanthamoeba castellanii str. Neff]
MNVEELPEEMLQHIFLALDHPKHLPRAALVCRVSNDPTVQRMWWGNHPMRLRFNDTTTHRHCRSPLGCTLNPAQLFAGCLITNLTDGYYCNLRFTGTRAEEPVEQEPRQTIYR